MKKPLSEMSLEELWQLFPIVLTEHMDCWAQWYSAESAELKSILPTDAEIHHVGSTAINGIWAKPIVDILVEVQPGTDLRLIKDALTSHGYLCMSESDSRISFNKGYTEDGFAEKVFHLHLRYRGDNDEILFRDYLNAHPDVVKEYERLKLGLWKKFEHDRDGYTAAKTEFVSRCMDAANSCGIMGSRSKGNPMEDKIAYCGLDCEKCDARAATVNNDDELRKKVAKLWSEMNGVEITPEMINCLGCRGDGVKTVYCESLCEIRKCALCKKVRTCGDCAEMRACKKVGMVIGNNAEALKNLENAR